MSDWVAIDVPGCDCHAVVVTSNGEFSREQLSRIGGAVMQARIERGWGKEAAARNAGINSITWKRVEDGLPVRDTSLRAIEKALGWTTSFTARLADDANAETMLTRDGTQKFIEALERRTSGAQSEEDEHLIRRFMAEERAATPPDAPQLKDVVNESMRVWHETVTAGMKLTESSELSDLQKCEILLDVNRITRLLNDHLVLSAYESTDLEARKLLPDLFRWRADGEDLRRRTEAEIAKINQADSADPNTSINVSRIRPTHWNDAPPPPPFELADAASTGHKQSDEPSDEPPSFPSIVRMSLEDLANEIPALDFTRDAQKLQQLYGGRTELPARVMHIRSLTDLLGRVISATEAHASDLAAAEADAAKGYLAIIKHLQEQANAMSADG
ncbi:hypothetical protein [Mycobacteroides abscessus]|uniref:hypothetical protein n=1 Tax=Mycobacteroides abscessus TaxID=36809 RepID=UPI0012AC3BF0|nr:hypothetical protein [Mycobacteroides abscessus]